MSDKDELKLLEPQSLLRAWGVLGSVCVGGGLLFVTLTGLVAWLVPFSVTSQMAVLFHTLAGLCLLVPFTYWQLGHWRANRTAPRSASKITAYVGFWVLAGNLVSGSVITYQAIFGVVTSHLWTGVHRWTGILVVPFLAFHVFPRSRAHLLAEQRVGGGEHGEPPPSPLLNEGGGSARRSMWMWSFGSAALLFTALIGFSAFYHSPRIEGYPAPGSFRAAPGANPFAPSNARTENSRPLPPEIISNSNACGAPGCHTTIFEEWRASAHRWSEEDQFFQAVRSATTEVQGITATEKCGGCHAPVSMLSGYKDPTLGSATSGYREGDSCVICHAVRDVDERGIGSYVLGIPKAYLHDHDTTRFAAFVNHFLIRVYPGEHDRDYDLKIARDAESCAPCHKEYDKVGKYPGLLEVETQYDDWKSHKWDTDRDRTHRLRCQQCHMYTERANARDSADPYDLVAGLGLEYHSHRFAAANQFMPSALGSPGAEVQTREVTQWLMGKTEINEIQKVWPQGPIIPLKIEASDSVRAGGALEVRVVLTNNKVGHSFPTGPLNIVRVWIELEVCDKMGKKVFHSGELDRENHVEAGSYILRPIALTESGHPILTPDIWHPQGPQFRPAINPGESASFEYRVPIPETVSGPLLVRAQLRYRKANQFFMNEVYDPDHREAPVTDLSSASQEIGIVDKLP